MENFYHVPTEACGSVRINLALCLGYYGESVRLNLVRCVKISDRLFNTTMIKLRLKRYGKKREVSYRIVAMNSRDRRDGRPLEELGFYNPRTDETRLEVPAILQRLKQGAQPTKTVQRILEKANVYEQLKS